MKYFLAACCIACVASSMWLRRSGDIEAATYRLLQAVFLMLCYRKGDNHESSDH